MWLVDYIQFALEEILAWLLMFAGVWLASSLLMLSLLVLVYWAIPPALFARIARLPWRVRGILHFAFFGFTLAIAESFAAFQLLDKFAQATASDPASWMRIAFGSMLSNTITWAVAGFVLAPWLEKKKYNLDLSEAVGFTLIGIFIQRLAGVFEVIITGPVAKHPALSGLFQFSLSHLGPNIVVLIAAFAVHRAGVRHAMSVKVRRLRPRPSSTAASTE
jgi:hypothetical protein